MQETCRHVQRWPVESYLWEHRGHLPVPDGLRERPGETIQHRGAPSVRNRTMFFRTRRFRIIYFEKYCPTCFPAVAGLFGLLAQGENLILLTWGSSYVMGIMTSPSNITRYKDNDHERVELIKSTSYPQLVLIHIEFIVGFFLTPLSFLWTLMLLFPLFNSKMGSGSIQNTATTT